MPIDGGRVAMRFPTLMRFALLLERYSHGALPEAFHLPQPSCGGQQRSRSLADTGPRGADPPGVKNKWIYLR